MPRTATRNRQASRTVGGYVDHFADHDRSMKRHRVIFRIISIVIGVFIAAVAVFMVWFLLSGQSISYSYDYQFGGVSYHESYNLDR